MKILFRPSDTLWRQLLTSEQTPASILRRYARPDTMLRGRLADEIIKAHRGIRPYPFGLLRRRSPDGRPYKPLSDVTLEFRRFMGNPRGPNFILRQTGRHILRGLRVLYSGPRKIRVGWTGRAGALAALQHTGRERTAEGSPIPARPHIGFQRLVLSNIAKIAAKWLLRRFRSL